MMRHNNGTLLLLLCMLFLTDAAAEVGEGVAASSECRSDEDDGGLVVDLIIIGAGWAAMAAADHVLRASASSTTTPISLLVLESSNRTGGRSQAYSIGGSSTGGGGGGAGRFVIELGSNWISGTEDTDISERASSGNKVLELAKLLGINTTFLGTERLFVDVLTKVYNSKGEDADPNGMIRKKLDAAHDCVWMDEAILSGSLNASLTLREAFSLCGWIPTTDDEFAVEFASRECEGNTFGVENAASTIVNQFYGEGHHFVTDQNPRGYASILDYMVQDTIPHGDARLIFNAHVSHIAFDDENAVTLTTRDGRKFRAIEVISTMPLGVLQKSYSSLFDPPFPEERISLLQMQNGIGMRNVTKIVLQFPSVWWNDEDEMWASVVKDFTTWRNLNHKAYLPGSKLLMTIFGDPTSSKYESLDDNQVQDEVMRTLRSQFRDIDIPDPLHFVISRHGVDETRYGAFSYFGKGWKEEFSDTLWAPLRDSSGKPRVWFAGEACCLAQHGYTHGALQSGKEVAARYLFENGLGPNPADQIDLDLCRPYPVAQSKLEDFPVNCTDGIRSSLVTSK